MDEKCKYVQPEYFESLKTYGGFLWRRKRVTIFFVTSSDSGSLVVDHLTSGGKLDSPVPQRVFWAVMGYSLHKGLQQEYYHATIIEKIRPDIQQFEVPYEEEKESGEEKKKDKWYRPFKRKL